MVLPYRRPERTNMTKTSGLVAIMWIGTLVFAPALVVALVGLWTGWTADLLGWVFTNLAELVLPDSAV